MKLLNYLIPPLLTITWAGQLLAQDSLSRPTKYVDVASIALTRTFSKDFAYTYVDHKASLPAIYPSLFFKRNYRGFIPNNSVTKKAIVQFNICNSQDTAVSVWFFPGLYFWNVQLYEAHDNRLEAIPSIKPDNNDNISYRFLTVQPYDSITIVAELSQVKTYLNDINPRLINTGYLPAYVKAFHFSNTDSDLITFLFCGLLLMLILYSLANFFQEGNTEFLFLFRLCLIPGAHALCKSHLQFPQHCN